MILLNNAIFEILWGASKCTDHSESLIYFIAIIRGKQDTIWKK